MWNFNRQRPEWSKKYFIENNKNDIQETIILEGL